MTKKLFWQDPYLTACDTRIATVAGQDITLEETILYAESGGQESDSGTIGNQPVLAARKIGKDLVYTLDPAHGFKAGDRVTVEIDWHRRYSLMRLHFAAEIVLELFYRLLPEMAKIGAHIGEAKARIDFVSDQSLSPLFSDIGRKAAALIEDDLPIVSTFTDEGAEKRSWMIAGFATVGCGGTHLRRTGEVGKIRLKRKNIGKGKERVEIFLDGTS